MPRIRFETSDREVSFPDGDEVNLLRVAIRNECGIPFKCASGNCGTDPVSYTHLRAHETVLDLVCRLLLAKKKER